MNYDTSYLRIESRTNNLCIVLDTRFDLSKRINFIHFLRLYTQFDLICLDKSFIQQFFGLFSDKTFVLIKKLFTIFVIRE